MLKRITKIDYSERSIGDTKSAVINLGEVSSITATRESDLVKIRMCNGEVIYARGNPADFLNLEGEQGA